MSEATQLVWLLGGSSGLGAALITPLRRRGCRVVVSARRDALLQAQAASDPEGVFPLALDATDPEAVRRAVAYIEANWGEIDMAILNVGDYEPMPLAKFDATLFARLMAVNFQGVVNALDALRGGMLQRGRGQILVTASVAGYRGLPGAAPYGASKAALINMIESLAPEFARCGVRLRLINPGFVRTRLTDKNNFAMPSLIEPDEAAEGIVRQLDGRHFEIRVPRLFTWLMRRVTRLPYGVWFWLIDRMLRP